MSNHKQKWDYSQIDDYLYLGADLCCGSDHYEYLINVMGIRADINLRREEMDRPSPLLEHYLWLPVEDKHAPTKSQLMVGARAIEELVKEKKKVFVHCTYGHGRSPTLMAAYLIVARGLSVEAAVAKLVEARPEVHLNEVQMTALHDLVE